MDSNFESQGHRKARRLRKAGGKVRILSSHLDSNMESQGHRKARRLRKAGGKVRILSSHLDSNIESQGHRKARRLRKTGGKLRILSSHLWVGSLLSVFDLLDLGLETCFLNLLGYNVPPQGQSNTGLPGCNP